MENQQPQRLESLDVLRGFDLFMLVGLKVYGMNSIVAYMLTMCVNFSCIGHSLLHGLQPYMGEYYSVVLTLSNVGIIYFILWELYKRKLFLRV